MFPRRALRLPWRPSRLLRRTGGALVGLAALALSFAAGAATRQPTQRADVVGEVRERLASQGVAPATGQQLDEAEISALLSASGDRWATWHPADQAVDASAPVDGRYSGVGLWLAPREGKVSIASVVPASPAAVAGLASGDDLLSVDGRSLDAADVTSAVASLRGPVDTSTHLVVRHAGAVRDVVLTRTDVASATDVHTETLDGGVLHVTVTAFSRGSAEALAAALAASPSTTGVLLDLRGDPGGLLGEAVEAAGGFLDGGPVVTYVRRSSAPVTLSADTGRSSRLPVVVLVDGATASAAEVLTGALQDRGRAVVVGQRTFGKASVQDSVTLTDGSRLELTVARYRTPSGKDLDGVGVTPDVETDVGDATLVRGQAVLRGLVAEAGAPSQAAAP